MANEVEASELVVAKEEHANEGISHVSSLVEGAAAEDSMEDVKDTKLEEKTSVELIHLENATQESVLTGIEDNEAEKARELNEQSKVTAESLEAVNKPNLNTVNEEIMETEIDPKPELGSASLASVEPKPVDEVMPGHEAVAGDKPVGTYESKPADELVPVLEPGDVPKEDEKSLPSPEPSNVPEDDKPLPGPEPSNLPEEDKKPLPGPEPVDEGIPGSEPQEDDKPLPGPEPGDVPEDDKPLPGPEPGDVPEDDKPLSGPEPSNVSEDDKPLSGPEPADEGIPGPEPADVQEEDKKPISGTEPVDEGIPESKPQEDDKPLPGPEPSNAPGDDKPLTGPEPSNAPEDDKPLTGPEPADEGIPGPEPADVQEEDKKPISGTEPVDEGIPRSESEEYDEPLPGDEAEDEPLPGDEAEEDEPLPGDEAEEDEASPGDEPEQDGELSAGLAPEPDDEELPRPETVQTDKHEQSDEPEAEDEQILGSDAEADSEDEEKEILQDDDNTEEKIEKPLDDDQDRRNPQYIPKGGAFYEHDNRTSLEDVENKDPQDSEKKKKSWKEAKGSEKWLHDRYNESQQQPKSTAEIIETYGYDIRRDDAPPRARRRRKYGRGPDKYERSWEDEQAYQMKQNNIGRRGRKKLFGKDEFPPLPNQKFDSSVSKPVQKSSIRKKEEVGSKFVNVKVNGNDKPPTPSQATRSSHSGNQNNLHGVNSNRKSYSNTNKKLNDSDIKPFRNDDGKWKMPFKHGRQDDFPKPIRTQPVRHTDPPFRRSVEANKNSAKEPHISQITDGMSQMTFVNKQADMRDVRLKANGPEESKINEPEVENPVNRQNPKRYSKIRKGFTGIFPPEEVQELDQTELHKLQQEQQKSQHLTITQPLNMQNVMKRYAGTYGSLGNCVSDFVPGTSSYLQARPIISGIPPQALSPQGIHQQALSPQGIHQQALSPQGIPQQALSPQVSGLPTIELQQNPLAQPNFVPQPMYVDPHYTSDVMSPFTGYPPYSGSQAGDVYQPSRGITYYNTECQTSGQKRPPPRRQNAAIPILPPEK